MMNNKKATSVNNIWDKEGFIMCGLGEKSKIIAKIKHMMNLKINMVFGVRNCRLKKNWKRIVNVVEAEQFIL